MHTDAQAQIKELEARILELRSTQINEVKERLSTARQVVFELEVHLAKLTGKAPTPAGAGGGARTRATSEEIRDRIIKVLAATPTGLRQMEIANATGLNYNTVVVYLKKNEAQFKTTGTLKSKRYFLQ